MNIIGILLISISLAADAFAVAVCKGLSFKSFNVNKCIIVGLYFGIFQGLMPFVGYVLGNLFKDIIVNVDHWISFVLLITIGANMIREALCNDEKSYTDSVRVKDMLPLAIATSIDALTVGITLSILNVNMFLSISVIGIVTFLLSFFGVCIGYKFGNKYRSKAEVIGGLILIFMGIKILLEHMSL